MALISGIGALAVPGSASGATGSLGALSWSSSSTTTGASGSAYTYGFTTTSNESLVSIAMTVPTGTAGTPTVGATSAWAGYAIPFTGWTASLAGTTLTFSKPSGSGALYIPQNTVVSIEITGLTNTSTPGSYTSSVTTSTRSGPADTGSTPPLTITSAALTNLYWSASSTKTSTAATYTYGFTTTSSGTLTAVTMSVPPGTVGTPTLGPVSPSAVAGGSISLSGPILTYSFGPVPVNAGTTVSITVSGLTNTPTASSFAADIVTEAAGSPLDSGPTPALSFTAAALTSLSLSASSTSTGATGVAYTFGFTVTTPLTLSAVAMSVPPGTGGTPAVSPNSSAKSASTGGYPISLTPDSVSLSGTILTFSSPNHPYLPSGAVILIEITGLTNTPTTGSYASSIVTISNQSPPQAVDSGTTPPVTFTSAALTSLSWTASSTSTGATGVAYTYSFGVSADTTLTSVTMTLPPGTGGTPAVGTATPSSLAGGAVSLAGQTLTYTLPASATITPTTTISIGVTGLTNTSTASTYASTVTAIDSANAVASGATPALSFTSTALTGLSWTASSTSTGTTGVAYTYGFTTASGRTLSEVTMTVPSGTGGTAAVGTVSAYKPGQGTITISGASASFAGSTTLALSFNPAYLPVGTTVSIEITGLTNTSQAGTYTSAITTTDGSIAVDSGATPAVSFDSSVLASPTWSVSSTAVGATAVHYTYTFGISTTSTITAVTMTVPSGTAGTPGVGAVSPSSVAGGTVSLPAGSQLLTYTLATPTAVSIGSTISIEITGLTNTSTAGSDTSTITATDDGTSVASGATPPVAFTATVLSTLSWSTSSSTTDATGVSYTFGFTTASAMTLSSVTMSVPPGTGGTSIGASGVSGVPSGGSASLSGTLLTYSFGPAYVAGGTAVSITISGLTNTSTSGSYTSAVSTKYGAGIVDSGTTPTLSFNAASVTLTAPSSLTWRLTLDGGNQAVVDQAPDDQQFSVSDATGTGAGWNVTVSASTFTDGTHTLPDTGTFSANGSTSSRASTAAPSITCLSSCTTPTNQVTYPVAITTAPSTPPSSVIYSASAGTGSGSFMIGGSTAAQPVGWWLDIPANTLAGTYNSTVTFAVSSGP